MTAYWSRWRAVIAGWADRYFAWLGRNPALVIALSLVALVWAALQAGGLTFRPDSRAFLSKENPYRAALEHHERTYNTANNVLIVLAPRSGDVFDRETLGLIATLTEAGWRTPLSSRIESLASHRRSFARGDELAVEPYFRNAAALTPAELAEIKRLVLADTDLVNRIVSPTGDVTGISIVVLRQTGDRAEVRAIEAHVRAMVAEAKRAHPDIDFYLTGGIMADAAFADAGRRDMTVLIPIVLGVILVALWLALRSVVAVAGTCLVVVGSGLFAMGVFAAGGGTLNGVTATAPVIIAVVCILDSVHVIATMRSGLARGLDRRAAVVASLRSNNVAMFATSLTDVVGFLALNFAESPPLNDLGNIVTYGVVAGYVLSISLLPAILVLMPAPGGRESIKMDGAMRWFSIRVLARPAVYAAAVAALTVVTASGMFRLALDDDIIRYFDRSFEFRRDSEFAQKRLTGFHAVSFSLVSGSEQGIADPGYLRRIDAFAEFLRAQDKVVTVISFPDIIKRLHMNLNDDDPAFRRIPDTKAAGAQILLLYELSVPFGRDLRHMVDIARSSVLTTAVLRGASSADIQNLARKGEAWLKANAPQQATTGSGLSLAYAYVSQANISAMLMGTVAGLLLVSLTMAVTAGSLRIGLLCLVPNLVPVFMAFGVWGWFVGEINLGASVVAAMTFGIIVDDTIHFVTKYVHIRRDDGLAPAAALRETFVSSGTPMTIASIVLVAGFGVFLFSGFAVSRQMGLLSAITIVFGAAVEFLLLPWLLLKADGTWIKFGPADDRPRA